jgi:putative phage-type endonuclease
MSALVIQNTPEWFSLRLGQVTGSRVADIVARTKTGYSASRANYLAQLVSERLTGRPGEGFTSAPMQWGIDHEAEARRAYGFRTGRRVELVGYVPHPAIAMAGASPDGLVGADGLVEIKCPNTATHIETLVSGRIPAKYEIQMLWQLASTGRAWCDFVSYDPRLPEATSLFVTRLPYNEERIAEIEAEVPFFLGEVDDLVDRVRRIGAKLAEVA